MEYVRRTYPFSTSDHPDYKCSHWAKHLLNKKYQLKNVTKILTFLALHGDQQEFLDYQLAKDLAIEPFSEDEFNAYGSRSDAV